MPANKFQNATLSINGEVIGETDFFDSTEGLERADCNLFRPVTIRLRAFQSYGPEPFRELTKESGVGPRNRWGGLK
jgi:hypothetical protein